MVFLLEIIPCLLHNVVLIYICIYFCNWLCYQITLCYLIFLITFKILYLLLDKLWFATVIFQSTKIAAYRAPYGTDFVALT